MRHQWVDDGLIGLEEHAKKRDRPLAFCVISQLVGLWDSGHGFLPPDLGDATNIHTVGDEEPEPLLDLWTGDTHVKVGLVHKR